MDFNFKELESKAWKLAEQKSVDEFGTPDIQKKTMLFGALFAQMIVEDCIQACNNIAITNQQIEGTYYSGKKAGAFDCVKALKAYLGATKD